LNRKGEDYPNATAKLNSGRNAINYILRTSDTQKVYLPYFTCGTVIETIITLNLKFEFYSIDKNLEIVGMSPEKLKPNEKMLYINYFGIKNDYVNTLAQLYAEQLIIDRKSTRLNSSHQIISYAVFCLKKPNQQPREYEGGKR